MNIGPKLKALLRHFEIRNVDIARRVGVSGGAVSNWFRFSTIEKENLAKVAGILKTTTEEILMLDVDEIVEKIEARKAARQRLDAIPGPTRDDLNRRTYSPEALNVAWSYDHLPSDTARAMVVRYLGDLEVGPGNVAKPSGSRVLTTGDPRSTARRLPVAAPTPKRRPKTNS